MGFTYDVPAKLSIPKGTAAIGSEAFRDCLALESVTIPDTVIGIRSDAFSRCKNLKSVNIPASVTSIESGAFEGCTSLTSVNIPASVTSIGYSAFTDCDKLDVKYAGTKAQWEEIKKGGKIGKFIVHCKDGDAPVGGEE